METAQKIYDAINDFAPFDTALSFDNAGFLVGEKTREVTKVLLSLDITKAVAEEARKLGAELIVSHHPVIFQPLKRLDAQDPVYLLARYGIAAICAHTNLDIAAGGVNTCLAQRLGLTECRPVGEPDAVCLVGTLADALPPEAFAQHVKTALGCGGLTYTCGESPVRVVGVCGGSGADFMEQAIARGAQGYVTADVKHHQLLLARAAGITLVDAGHFCTEDVVIDPLRQRLAAAFPETVFIKSKENRDPACYL